MHLIDPNNYYLNDVFWDFLDASDELPEDNHFVYIENFDLSKNISSVIKKIKDCEINCGYACHYRNQKISWHAPIFEYCDKTILYMKKNNIFDHTGTIYLENFFELKSFLDHMALYPSNANYVDIYVACHPYIFEISHHKHIFLYKSRNNVI